MSTEWIIVVDSRQEVDLGDSVGVRVSFQDVRWVRALVRTFVQKRRFNLLAFVLDRCREV